MALAHSTAPKALYDTLYAAFDHFNAELFDDTLPPAVLLLARKRNAHGYFHANQWTETDKDESEMSEIALNPHSMARSPREVLSTLVHEMVHHQQECFGKPSKTGHNKEWAEWMDLVGLEPTSTGAPGGKRTGRKVTHMITEGGPFDVACAAFLANEENSLGLAARPQLPGARKKDLSKVKHTCPDCGLNVWGKLGMYVSCGTCDQPMSPEDF